MLFLSQTSDRGTSQLSIEHMMALPMSYICYYFILLSIKLLLHCTYFTQYILWHLIHIISIVPTLPQSGTEHNEEEATSQCLVSPVLSSVNYIIGSYKVYSIQFCPTSSIIYNIIFLHNKLHLFIILLFMHLLSINPFNYPLFVY